MQRNGRKRDTGGEPRVLSREEFRRLVAARVQDQFGMTLEQFAEAFRSGSLDSDPAAYDLALLVGGGRR